MAYLIGQAIARSRRPIGSVALALISAPGSASKQAQEASRRGPSRTSSSVPGSLSQTGKAQLRACRARGICTLSVFEVGRQFPIMLRPAIVSMST